MMRIFSLRGAHLIAMFAKTEIAKEFRKWALDSDILERETAISLSPASEETLTPLEVQILHEVIDHKAAGCGSWKAKAYPEIYTRLQNKFRVNSYKLLPRNKLTDAILYVTDMELRSAPKLLPERVPVRKVGDLGFFNKSGRESSYRHSPESFSIWWDYPQHL
ncbi:ORF6C domain-containing protein [Nitrosomonas communis]|uniref:ORF6C domain-containing protein n=1 Tax=Nitrosomonas communis TaxID=44574 RepID=UPI003D2BB029